MIKSIFELPPDISGIAIRTGHHPTLLTYEPVEVVKAWSKFLQAVAVDSSLLQSKTFHYDFVDITRQVLANLFIPLLDDMIAAWNTSTAETSSITDLGESLQDLLSDMDRILSTDENFLVSGWIHSARSWTNGTDEDTRFLEYDARNQITLWVCCIWVPHG